MYLHDAAAVLPARLAAPIPAGRLRALLGLAERRSEDNW